MATNNITFPIYNADGTPFNGLVLHNATFDSVVMSLGDKITGDVYYRDNTLAVTMSEYIEYKRNEDSEAVRFVLVNPPTVVREGIVSDNSELRGMTKYSFVFYHPMYAVSNFPFTDVAVSSDEQKYLSNSKTFNWIGNLFDMVAKLNKNLQGTQWVVGTNIEHYEQDGVTETSIWQKAAKIPDEPLSFDKTYVSEVLKTSYETWEIPFIVDQIAPADALYAQGKRFLILFGTPSNEILDDQDEPYIFRFGQGVGLKNNSRTPKNNKIVTRIVGYGSENNIPFGYPQIQWFGDQTWKYTVNNDLSAEGSLPIYKGILGGRYVNLIKHPFTRKTLMPSVYRETLFNKVSPYMPDGTLNQNFDPTIELVDYYDADGSYVNPVVEGAESVEIHQFDDIKPEFTEHSIVDAFAYDSEHEEAISYATFIERMNGLIVNTINENEKVQLTLYRDSIDAGMTYSDIGEEGGSYTWHRNLNIVDEYYMRVRYTSDSANFNWLVVRKNAVVPATQWDDTMDDDGNYKQSYFKMTLPQLDFDLYACASITEEMQINMRSGACIGCTFDIVVDWDDYKKNFYDSDGNFLPDGEQRDLTKYPKTNLGQVTFVVKKDLDTFGTLMPNTYQQPHSGDEFVILGISLPTTYVTNAEARLDDAAKEYMRENNVHYYEYPLKFDEHFLATHTDILSQIRNNTIVRFQYGGELPMDLYVKQITVKYSGVLPTYDITLTDDVEIVLNQIGQVADDVSRMRVQVSELQKYYSENIIQAINEKLSKVVDDVCQGRITFQQGLDSIGSAIFHDELRSPDFTSGLYTGRGWRIDQLGNAEFESVRARSFLEVVELLVNRMQSQEGDTVFSDNDQIDRVDKYVDPTDSSVFYVLSLKEKWAGYYTPQMYGNILKGVINTLAAKDAGVSDVQDSQTVEKDGSNSFFTSWMRVIATHNTDNTLSPNQIRVVLYGDNEVPAQKNFEPCELMTMTRWGCINYSTSDTSKYEAEGLDTQDAILASIKRRQQVFYISTSEGRIVKLTGVDSPILRNGNFGTTLGILPEFVQNYPVVHDRMIAGRDYLYAQGVVVGDFIKIDIDGNPIPTMMDEGEWVDGSRTEPLTIKVWDAQQQRYVDHVLTFPIPSSEYNNPSSLYIGHGIYFYNKFNALTQQYETHRVRHNGGTWQCLQSQPVISGGVATYYEPNANSPYWMLVNSEGSFPQQIFYRDQNNQAPATPATSQSDAIPSGWTATPQGVGGVYRYEWVSMRIKTDGVWGAYSTPALYAYLAEDGTSFNIKGSAITLEIGDANDVQSAYEEQSELSKTEKGDVILGSATHTDSGDHYILRRTDKYWDEDRGRYAYFVFESVQEGEAYVISAKQSVPTSYDGHFFLASPRNDDVASGIYYWKDLGYLKGVKGDDAVMYVLEPSIPQFNTDQKRSKTQTCTIRAYKIEGKTKSAFTGCFEIYAVVPAGMIGNLSYSSGNYVSFGTNDDRNATAYTVSLWDKDPRFISIDEPDPVLLASITIPIAFDGVQGKMGRNLWFAGWWDDVKGTSFSVDDHSAPYVQTGWADPSTKKIPVCKLFIGTNGNFTYPSTVAGYENNANWGAMVSDFEYLITKAVFAALAKLGSWTFNSDYMYSDLGLNHSTQQESAQGNLRYDGIGDSDNTWTPNVSIDAANGRASFGRDKVRFNPDGSGWVANKNISWDANGKSEFSGIIHASLLYSNTIDVDGGMYTIDPENSPANTFMVHSAIITLPSAEDYLGLELKFFEPHPTTRSIHVPTTLSPQSNEYIAKTYFDLVPLLEMVTQYEVPMGRFVTLKATNLWYNGVEYYCWMVVSGDDGGYSGTVQIGNKTMTYLNGMLMDVETV